MLKFFQETGGLNTEHGGRLHWPGTVDGFPYRGEQAPLLKQQEMENLPLALDYRSKLFELWKPEDKKAFDETMDRIVNGWYMQHRRKDIEVEGQAMPAVWLEWVQIYGESPGTKHPGGSSNGNGHAVTVRPGDPSAVSQTAREPHPSPLRFEDSPSW
jgi:hypothetical protein